MQPLARASTATLAGADLSPLAKGAAVLVGAQVLALSSYVSVPMPPVPMTLQTLAVTVIGAVYGWRLGALTVLVWLAEGAAGLPVFANGAAGLARFAGPTAGYLVSFPFAAALVGWLAERGWTGDRLGRSFLAMCAGNALSLALGAAWLAAFVGPQKAIALGVAPFALGGLVKSALGAAATKAGAEALRRVRLS